MPKSIEQRLPDLRSTASQGAEAIVQTKYFYPMGRYTLFVTEFDGEDTLFGWCLSPLEPSYDEFGYASLEELAIALPHGLPIERDLSWEPKTLGEALKEVGAEKVPA